MTRYQLIRKLQNSPLTGWWWTYWQHEELGNITIAPWYKNLGPRWYKIKHRD